MTNFVNEICYYSFCYYYEIARWTSQLIYLVIILANRLVFAAGNGYYNMKKYDFTEAIFTAKYKLDPGFRLYIMSSLRVTGEPIKVKQYPFTLVAHFYLRLSGNTAMSSVTQNTRQTHKTPPTSDDFISESMASGNSFQSNCRVYCQFITFI